MFYVAGNTDDFYKKEIKINIKDRFVGEDPTGKCLFTNFAIGRVVNYYV